MKITLADHFGMCFGVRDAVAATEDVAQREAITVLGDLVHNPVVDQKLASLGVKKGALNNTDSSATNHVVITAHGASDRDRENWQASGYAVTDTTCPLVKKAHTALASLVVKGFHPVVVGKRDHVEVRGLTGDFPEASVVIDLSDIDSIPRVGKIGIISQTTQPIAKVNELVDSIRRHRPDAEIEFVDTVCQPTKRRQDSLVKLCQANQLVIVVGGHHSNNTSQLVKSAQQLGVVAHHVATPDELQLDWFTGMERVGITAGTSTLHETVYAVRDQIVSFFN